MPIFRNGPNAVNVYNIIPTDLNKLKDQNLDNNNYQYYLKYNDTSLFPYRSKDMERSSRIYYYVSPPVLGNSHIVVVKRFMRTKDFLIEKNASESVARMVGECRSMIIDSKIMDEKYLIMEFFDSDAHVLFNNMDKRKNIDHYRHLILIRLVEAIKCFYDDELYYTDVKLDQILYTKHKNGSIRLALADLFVSKKEDKGHHSTYPSPYFNSLVPPTLMDIEWGIMSAILETYNSILCLHSPYCNTSVPSKSQYHGEWTDAGRVELLKKSQDIINKSRKHEFSSNFLNIAQMILDTKGRRSIGLDIILDYLDDVDTS